MALQRWLGLLSKRRAWYFVDRATNHAVHWQVVAVEFSSKRGRPKGSPVNY